MTRINNSHTHADRGLDCYWTPHAATRALMAIERLPKSIVDPCCGSGAILEVLKRAGHTVRGSDVIDYGWPHTKIRDYLAKPVPIGDAAIITNPPFLLAEAFIRKAILDGCHYHARLLRTNFLESVGRLPFWREHPPSRVWIASRRLPMMHRWKWDGKKSSSNISFAWFVFEQGSRDLGKLDWFDWRSL